MAGGESQEKTSGTKRWGDAKFSFLEAQNGTKHIRFEPNQMDADADGIWLMTCNPRAKVGQTRQNQSIDAGHSQQVQGEVLTLYRKELDI